MEPISIPIEEVMRFLVVLMRVSGIMLLAPLFSSHSIPFSVRTAFALILSLTMTPLLPLSALPAGLTLGNIAGLVFSEVLIGAFLGFAAACVFAGLQFAGQIISFQLGFSVINVIDPQTQVETSVFSFFQNYIGILFFLLMNGHHWFLMAIDESFRSLPVGGIQISGPFIEHLVRLSADILVIGVRIAGPILAVTIITDVVIGVLGRAAPQIHLLIVGMPLKLLVGFGCLSFSFYFLPRYLETIYSSLYRTLFSLLHAMI
ncbi:MAG: flagellar biosynthetic protein FliR [Acidobacteria bacterium]|nr:flagellar biosynthetic protein FliR [Acidobacteriota bacterium]